MALSKSVGLSILIVLFLFSCASGPPLHEGERTIAVWDLDDLSPSRTVRSNLGELLSNQIIEVLKKGETYKVIERERLLLALEELRLGTTSLVDETTRLRLGRLIGARWMVFGGYQVIGGQMRIDLRLVEVETGRVRKAVERMVPAGNVQGWMDATQKAAEGLF
jgi:curli biogenesis system outer membrane secretion channel CsgG